MRESIQETYARYRNPAYTGENRCLPCTVVNVGIALVVSLGVAVVSRKGALVAFVGSIATIGLRGYLVPGTPTLTKRYLPDHVLARFESHPPVERHSPSEREQSTDRKRETIEELERQREQTVDPERFLLDVGAVEPLEDGSDLRFTDALATEIDEQLASLPNDPLGPTLLADLYGLDAALIEIRDRSYPAAKIGRRVHRWPSTAALTADVATHRALSVLTDRWDDVPQGQRIELLEVLRSFHAACPGCGGAITMTEDTIESCCRAYEVLALVCADCESALLELDPNEIGGTDGGIEP
jgi:hypothetical protein